MSSTCCKCWSDNDNRERCRVAAAFLLEVYKVAMGTLLCVFVVHNCPETDEECSIADSFALTNSTSVLHTATLSVNSVTLFFVCALYVVELARENWMIRTLDINPEFPDAYLDDVAPPAVLAKLRTWNHRYWKSALFAAVFAAANVAVSSVFLFQNFRGSSTATACASFALLVLMKLYESFQRAKRDNAEQRARSAFMTEDCSFNVMDPDYANPNVASATR
tara:strand:+ start:1619 stop:2281 length:663 start_codon:yes stop_codon:yes gene_type:complete